MLTNLSPLTLIRFGLLALCCLLLGACASISVKQDDIIAANPPNRIPDMIFVAPFTFYDPGVRVDRSGSNLDTFEKNLQDRLTHNLMRRLERNIAPTTSVNPDTPLPRGNYWLITGRFDRVSQGSRALRMLIGLGAGGTKLETQVIVWDLSGPQKVPFLVLKTTGGSNISAGALTGMNQWGIALNAISSMHTGLTFDTIRTSHEITASMSDYLREEGALSPDQAMTPKKLGHFPSIPRIGSLWPFNQKKQPTGTVSVTPAAQQ